MATHWVVDRTLKPQERAVIEVGPVIVYVAYNDDHVAIEFYGDHEEADSYGGIDMRFDEMDEEDE